jgi:hypothetical protein
VAEGRAKQHEIEGRVLHLDVASKLAVEDWEKLAEGIIL